MPKNNLKKYKSVFIAGHRGMVGSAIKNYISKKYKNLKIITASRTNLDLRSQKNVLSFFKSQKPDLVIIAAAKVGGILANSKYPAEFIYDNLMIQNNVIHAAYLYKVKRLLFLGSSCIYPKLNKQPIKEEDLLSGKLEETNEAYAISKIAGIKLCQYYNKQFNTDFRSVMPTNLYGPGDNYDLNNSHVIPALIRKFHDGKTKNKQKVIIWGTGKPKREFLFVDDLAKACLLVLQLSKRKYSSLLSEKLSHINIGYGEDISIRKLSKLIAKIVKFNGKVDFDISKPDGTPKKLLDVSLIKDIGFVPSMNLEDGIAYTYKSFLKEKGLK